MMFSLWNPVTKIKSGEMLLKIGSKNTIKNINIDANMGHFVVDLCFVIFNP